MSPARFEARHFGMPLSRVLVAVASGVSFLVLGTLVALADRGLLTGDVARLLRGNPDALAPKAFSALLLLSGLGTLLRAKLAGVSVQEDRLVVRSSYALGIPRVQVAYWPELRAARFRGALLVLVQYDGSFLELPPVADQSGLEDAIRERARRFGIPFDQAFAEG